MMLIDRASGRISHSMFQTLPALLDENDILVINDTAVFPARLFASPKAGMSRRIELLLTRRVEPFIWTAWCKPARRIRKGDILELSSRLRAHVLEKGSEGAVTIRFEGADETSVWDEIERIGVTPLPPYIHRHDGHRHEGDRDAYQTVYASARGAIAAPTAGLHFSEAILGEIEARGVEIIRVTLHVGIGTFQPVKVDDIADHRMDSERYVISENAAARLNAAVESGKSITAVGTTSVRVLESAIAAGEGTFGSGEHETSIFITPGYEFRAVKRLLTNFHLPESTLIMLVSAFAGSDLVRAAYREAVAERYLFYSFGDCMLIT